MEKVGSLLNWIGGGVTRTAASGLAIGLFMVVVGMTPAQAVAYVLSVPPPWLMSGWMRIAVLVVGLGLIWISINYNRWSRKQKTIDSLADDISWAIRDLVNRDPKPTLEKDLDRWYNDYAAWCERVNEKLENRAFFTRADRLHFSDLGFVPTVRMSDNQRFDWMLSQLSLKFDRLRDVINWTQQRRMS